MSIIARLRDLDSRAWSAATWAAPFTVQVVLGAMFIVLWLIGKTPPFTSYNVETHSTAIGERAWLLTGAAITALVSVLVSGLFLSSRSSRARVAGLSIAGSAAVVLVGAIVYAFWFLRW